MCPTPHAPSAETATSSPSSARHTARLTSMTTARSGRHAIATSPVATPDSSDSMTVQPGAGAQFLSCSRGTRSASSASSAAAARLQPTSTTSLAQRSISRRTVETKHFSMIPITCAVFVTQTTATRLRLRMWAGGSSRELRSIPIGSRFQPVARPAVTGRAGGMGSNLWGAAPATGFLGHLHFRSKRIFSN